MRKPQRESKIERVHSLENMNVLSEEHISKCTGQGFLCYFVIVKQGVLVKIAFIVSEPTLDKEFYKKHLLARSDLNLYFTFM